MTPERAVGVIAVDWGSSRLRVSALSGDGGTVRTASSPDGILLTPRAEQRGRLLETLGPFRDAWPDAPIIAAGMIGSRNGLTESVPVPVPAGASEIAAGIRPLTIDAATTVYLAPGVVDDTAHPRDLIRGEEVQVVGWLTEHPTIRHATLILPGTHSKWVCVADGKIAAFRTFLSGEMYARMVESPSFAAFARPRSADADVAEDPTTDAPFRDGVRQGFSAEGLLHDLFAARSRALSASADFAIESYLSGLLVGYEIAEARVRGLLPADGAVALLSAGPLKGVYRAALELCGIAPRTAQADPFGRGAAELFARYTDLRPKESP
jgi:2-dehydro-3-deoxygalactonokinase